MQTVSRANSTSRIRQVCRCVGHVIGVTTVASVLALALMGSQATDALAASTDPQLAGHGLVGVATHLGLATTLWIAVVVLVRAVLQHRDEPRRAVKLRRGATTTETLILFPFLLLMVSGLSQLAMMNVASLLTNLAAFNAGRAVWVWDGQDASTAECEHWATVGAAHAVLPSVPSDFQGAGGWVEGNGGDTTYASAYDTGSLEDRVDGKLAFAMASVHVEAIRGATTGANLTYHFRIAFPWFAYMFGQRAVVGNQPGYFRPLYRTYTLPAQP